MKKFFKVIGLMTLMCVSFFYTEKTAKVVKEYDDVMIQIRDKEKKCYKEATDAVVTSKYIVPGISGEKIDANSSYSKMKRYGNYDDTLLVFKKIKPVISIEDYYDKYITSGNKSKNAVSIIFLVNDTANIKKLTDLLDSKDVKANFFFDGNIIEKEKNLIKSLIYKEHNIGNLGFNGSYDNKDYTWVNVYLKKLQKFSYCYTEEENDDVLNICSKNKNQTIIPSIKVTSINKDIKSKLESGNIIAMTSNIDIDELSVFINYIKSKGYNIITLNEMLKE